MDLTWETVESRLAWQGRFPVYVDTLRARHDGRQMEYTYLGVHRGAVAVLALDDEQRVICVRQYRHPLGRVTLEIPAGHIDSGEDPATTAAREFEEETGLRLDRLEPLGRYTPFPSLAGFDMHLFVGFDLRPGRQRLDDAELLEVVRMPLDELRAAILNGDYVVVTMNYALLLAEAKGLLPATRGASQ